MKLINTIATHLAKQQKRSVTEKGCAYRGDGGTMCAVGCLIPDELYTDRIETLTYAGIMSDDVTNDIQDHLLKILVEEPFTDAGAFEFYSAVQQFHDGVNYENCIDFPVFKQASEEKQIEMVKKALIEFLIFKGIKVHRV